MYTSSPSIIMLIYLYNKLYTARSNYYFSILCFFLNSSAEMAELVVTPWYLAGSWIFSSTSILL